MTKHFCDRYVGLDVHQKHVMIVAVDQQQHIIMKPQKIAMERFREWATHHLTTRDHVVLEASTGSWHIVDQLTPLVKHVAVAHATNVKLIASTLVKTDKRDAIALARLLAADLIPEVWVPPPHVRELRQLVHHRQELVKQRKMAIHRLRSILHRYHIRPPASGLGTGVVEPWWQTLAVSSTDQLIITQNRRLLAELDQLIKQTENELARLSASEGWIDQVTYLIQLPGVGMRSAMILLSAIGDIHRFPKAKQLVGYSGLGARIHSSGQTHRTGGITKSGRREIRTTMIEVAWNAVKHDAQWRGQFDQLASRIGRAKAIVAIARKLLVVIWHVLSKQQPDRHADPQAVARSFMRWASYHRVATSLNLKRTTFVRRELNRLGIGQTVSELRFSSRRHRLPPPETVPVAT